MDSIYHQYSSALLSLAISENKVPQYKESIINLLTIFRQENDIFKFLGSYFLKEEDKYRLVDELTKNYQLKYLNSFLKLLVKTHRIFILDKIANDFVEIANENLGILEGFIYSVNPLSKNEIDKVKVVVSKKINQEVELINLIDESLIGGVKVVVHDHIFDGSISGKLNALKTNLNERRELK